MIWKCEQCGTTWAAPLSFDDKQERLDWESAFRLFGCNAMLAMARGENPWTVNTECGRNKPVKKKKTRQLKIDSKWDSFGDWTPIVNKEDKVNPDHYITSTGAETIDIAEDLNFCLGNVVKYVSRAGKKQGESKLDDLQKALWYLQREMEREGK